MGNIKKRHSPAFKTKVALEAIRGAEPVSAICSRYSIHPTQVSRWKDRALESMAAGFNNKAGAEQKKKDELIEELYKQIGQLKVEQDWLKKNMGLT
jgi:transposase-like protein